MKNWAINWSFLTAVKRWAIDPELFVSIENAESCLPQVFDDAFEGRYGRLRERADMKPLAAVLPDILERLKQKIESVGLDRKTDLPPVVWLRLMHEANVTPVDAVVKEFELWQEQMRANGLLSCTVALNEAKERYVGPMRKRNGLGKVAGFTVEEMLNEQHNKTHWPYCYRWKCIPEASSFTVDPLVRQIKTIPSKPTIVTSGQVVNIKAPIEKPRKRRKRRRSRQALERVCGVPMITAFGSLFGDRTYQKAKWCTWSRNQKNSQTLHMSVIFE